VPWVDHGVLNRALDRAALGEWKVKHLLGG
jgi:hypothetical protein